MKTIKFFMIIVGLYLLVIGGIVLHEEGHKQIYAEYGIDSYYTINPFTLYGKTNPILLRCNDINCVEIAERHRKYEESWGLYYE